jgi:hypothetical protein
MQLTLQPKIFLFQADAGSSDYEARIIFGTVELKKDKGFWGNGHFDKDD